MQTWVGAWPLFFAPKNNKTTFCPNHARQTIVPKQKGGEARGAAQVKKILPYQPFHDCILIPSQNLSTQRVPSSRTIPGRARQPAEGLRTHAPSTSIDSRTVIWSQRRNAEALYIAPTQHALISQPAQSQTWLGLGLCSRLLAAGFVYSERGRGPSVREHRRRGAASPYF